MMVHFENYKKKTAFAIVLKINKLIAETHFIEWIRNGNFPNCIG